MRKSLAKICLLFIGVFMFSSCNLAKAHLSKQSIEKIKPVSEMNIPKKSIVALGEATHGNKEFQELKSKVFENVLKNNNCRVFVLEGDFGGCQKVNDYILTGKGTAENAVKEIGFGIYKTKEMVDVVKWMKDYNEKVEGKDKIHFYGCDMQRYDNNKQYLFDYIEKVDKEKKEKYEKALKNLNDDTIFDKDTKKVKTGLNEINKVISDLEKNKKDYINKTSEKEFDIAIMLANNIKENATLRGTGVNYGKTRDSYMAKKVKWIYNYESKYYGRNQIFLSAHNGHVDKTSATKGITSMGEHLKNIFKDEYYSIGTDCYETEFLAYDSKSDSRKEFKVKNKSQSSIAFLLNDLKVKDAWIDLHKVKENKELNDVLSKKQRMITIGDKFTSWYSCSNKFYTLNIEPCNAYDAIIFIDSVKPVNILK